MHAVASAFHQHLRIARTYPVATLIVAAILLRVLYLGFEEQHMGHAVGYIAAVWLGALTTDVIVNLHPQPGVGFPIRHSAYKELALILSCTALGLLFLSIRFSPLWSRLSVPHHLTLAPLLLFVYPIVLALLYLTRLRYKPSELGVNLRYWYLALIVHLIVGGIALSFAHAQTTYHRAVTEMGLPGALFTGLVCAALSEEFLRMLLQTRLGAALHNKGLGFVFASCIWALLQIPNFTQGSHADPIQMLYSVWTIVPFGLLWGYATHRTKSLLPAVLIHGLNFWGMQNM